MGNNAITLRDALRLSGMENRPVTVMYRITLPPETAERTGYEDTLFGYCEWDGTKLAPLDGDNYSLDDGILHFETFETEGGEEMLSVTVEGAPVLNPDGSVNMG